MEPYVTGPCRLTHRGACVASPNYPEPYGGPHDCTVFNVPAVPLQALAFEIEPPFVDRGRRVEEAAAERVAAAAQALLVVLARLGASTAPSRGRSLILRHLCTGQVLQHSIGSCRRSVSRPAESSHTTSRR